MQCRKIITEKENNVERVYMRSKMMFKKIINDKGNGVLEDFIYK